MRRHRREGGVQCRVGSTQEPATGLSVAAGWESRSPSEVESDDQAINPARGGEVPLKKTKGRGAHRPAAPGSEQSLERKYRCEGNGVLPH
jgi:hypothetical protein